MTIYDRLFLKGVQAEREAASKEAKPKRKPKKAKAPKRSAGTNERGA
jgi:hypothetical protein